LGRVFNVLGNVIDDKDFEETEERWPIHRPAPTFSELSNKAEVYET